jgi:acyl-CoA thioester hydrolase
LEHISRIAVRYAETDAMGVAYHANYLIWFEVARTGLLAELGYPYARLEADGIMLPVVEAHCRYKKPAVFDDRLEIHCRCTDLKGASMTLSYQVLRTETGELLAEGWTKHGLVDRDFRLVKLREANPELYRIMSEEMGG